jgi:hypothetical protein
MKVFKRKYRANPITKTIVERVKAEKFEIPTDCSNAEREFFLDRINSFKKLNKRVKVIITDKLGDDLRVLNPLLMFFLKLNQLMNLAAILLIG